MRMVFLLESRNERRGRLLISVGHVCAVLGFADNKRITRSGAERKGWPCVMVRGWQERCRGAAPRKSSVNAVFRRGGFTVGTVYA